MLNWFWRSSSYPQSRAESPVLLYRTSTYLHVNVIKPLSCLGEGCVPFTDLTLSIFPSVILPFLCLLSSNVLLSKSASQVSVFCRSSGLAIVQYPEFFIVWFIFDLYILVLCSIYLLQILDFCHILFQIGNICLSVSLQCFSTMVWPRFKVSGLYQNTINYKNTSQVCMKLKIRFFCISQCLPSNILLFFPFFSLCTPKNALS